MDVEATCEEGCGFSFENEIIELPCLLFDLIEKSIIDEFHSYVRPSMNPTLSDYCKSLTGIQQCTVDKAPIFSDVLEELFIFLRKHSNILVPSVDEIEIIEPLKSVPRTQPKNWAWACDGPWDMASFLAKQVSVNIILFGLSHISLTNRIISSNMIKCQFLTGSKDHS